MSTCHNTLGQTVLFHCNEIIRDTTAYEFIYTYYDYISINTMKMFVVRRYWNMDSIYIYICCHAHMYICIWLCVYMHCVCSHALHSGILEQCYLVCTLQRLLVQISLEAKRLFALVCSFNGLFTDEWQIVWEGKKVWAGQFEGFRRFYEDCSVFSSGLLNTCR